MPSSRADRRTYAALAMALMAFAVYLSLLPFRLQFVPLDAAWAHFASSMTTVPARVPRANFLANLLLFVPIGFGLAGAWLLDRPGRRVVPVLLAALAASVATSVTAEFAQAFAPGRVVSVLDVVAQALGCGVGVLGWALVGPAVTDWILDARRQVGQDRVSRVLVAYAALWALANLAPFDITLDVDRLGQRVRDGAIAPVPFAQPLTARAGWDIVVSVASSIPLGIVALFAGARAGVRRSAWGGLLWGVLGVAAIEVAQVFIRSHAATGTDLVSGAVGVAIGIGLGLRLRPLGGHAAISPEWGPPWAWAGLVAWGLMVAGYHWQPFDFAIDAALVRQKLARISLVPFAGYSVGSDLAALNNLIAKVAVAAPLGAIAALIVPRRLSVVVAATWALSMVGVFGAVELGQFFVSSRVPDPTDVWVGVAASAAGLWLGRWVRSGFHREPD